MATGPQRGEIWYVKLSSDPNDKAARPVIVVSADERNLHERATTVLVVPLSTTPPRSPTHILLKPGETGLSENSTVQPEGITTVRKSSLQQPRQRLRRQTESTIRLIAKGVLLAMGLVDPNL